MCVADGVVGTEVGHAGMGRSEFQDGGTPAGIEGTGIEGGALAAHVTSR